MAINPLIALKGRVPDIGQSFSNALLNVQKIDAIKQSREQAPVRQRLLESQTQTSEDAVGRAREQAPIRQRLLESQTQTSEAAVPTAIENLNRKEKNLIRSVSTFSRQALPVLQSGDIEGTRTALQNRRAFLLENNLPTRETDEALVMVDTDPLGLASQMQNSIDLDDHLSGVTGAKPVFKEGVGADGKPGLFSVTSEGAARIPGIAPIKKTPLVQIGGDKQSEQKELGKLRAQDLKSIRTRGDEATQNLNSLNVLDNINVETGTAEPMKQAIASFASGFGIDASGLANIAAGQAFTAEAGRVVLRVMATQKGPQTDKDQARIAKTLTRLGNQPAANTFINDSARAVANRALDQRDFYDKWLDANDTLKGVASSWNKLKRDAPMVSQHVQNESGLPVFFFRFRERVLEANPGATEDQVLNAWRRQEKDAKKARK